MVRVFFTHTPTSLLPPHSSLLSPPSFLLPPFFISSPSLYLIHTFQMKTFTLLLSIFACYSLNAQIIDIDAPTSYLPTELANYKIGLGINDFQKLNDTAKLQRDASVGFRFIKFTQNTVGGSIASAYFKFDTPMNGVNANRPLYEISMTFNSPELADDFAKSHFTSPYRPSEFADKEWFLSTTKDYWIIIRKTEATITIAAMMTGTEWGFE